MMEGNPYFVNPMGDYSKGLAGLTGAINQFGKERKADQAKKDKETIFEGAAEVYKKGDPEAIAEYSLKYPEVRNSLISAVNFRDQSTKENFINSSFKIIQNADNPEEVANIVKSRQAFLKAKGIPPEETRATDSFLKAYEANPENAIKKLKGTVAAMAPERYKAYRETLGTADTKKTGDVKNFEYYQNLKETHPDLADSFGIKTGFKKDDKTAAVKNFNTFINLLNTDPEKAKLFGDSIGINRTTPYTDMAKLKTDLNNGLITEEDYQSRKEALLNPTMKNKTELTMAALRGNEEAKNVLKALALDDVTTAGKRSQASTEGKLTALYAAMDLDGVAQAVLEGKETIDNVRNTFGVPIQEVVREKILSSEPDFNFVQPRAIQKSLSSSLAQQQKNRGAMGSFVKNINGQLSKVEDIMRKVINRVGVRALDYPWRELHTRFKGSGHERVLEAYMKEISVEIYKLSQGSTASVALLPEKGRIEWEGIHDVTLSYPELKKVLVGTNDMANIRLKSVNDEIKETIDRLGNIRELKNVYTAGPGEAGAEFEDSNTITVTNPDTGEEEVWDTVTEKRIK